MSFLNWLKQWTIIKKVEIEELKETFAELNIMYDESIDDNKQLRQTIEDNKNREEQEEELEKYWNDKRPKIVPTHNARENITMDLRQFYQKNDMIPYFLGTNDEKASQALDWCIKHLTYVADQGEYWQFAYETARKRTGDCEDGSILMANMMLNSGIPYWRVRICVGFVLGGYHAWVAYLRESDNQWVTMDWCYFAHKSKGLNYLWKDSEEYFQIEISFNTKYGYGRGEELDRR